MPYQSQFPFGTQKDAQDAALDRMGPPVPTVGGAAVPVGARAKAVARKHQLDSQGLYRSEFSRMRAEDPASVDAWRAKAFGSRSFMDEFIPAGGDPISEPAKEKPVAEEVA
jgi:hypothetical protein